MSKVKTETKTLFLRERESTATVASAISKHYHAKASHAMLKQVHYYLVSDSLSRSTLGMSK